MSKRKSEKEILEFIELVRHSAPNMVDVFTKGSCYRFFKMLKAVEPRAVPYHDGDHVLTRIGNDFYDITGKVEDDLQYFHRLEDAEVIKRLERCVFIGI